MQKKASNRSFGLLFFIVFLIIACWPLLNSEAIRLWALTISLAFLILGILPIFSLLWSLDRGVYCLVGMLLLIVIFLLVYVCSFCSPPSQVHQMREKNQHKRPEKGCPSRNHTHPPCKLCLSGANKFGHEPQAHREAYPHGSNISCKDKDQQQPIPTF